MKARNKRHVLLRQHRTNDNESSAAETSMVSLPSLDDPAFRRRFARALAELIADAMLRPNGQTK